MSKEEARKVGHKFKIKVDYTTGNSFETHQETDILDYEWQDIEVVLENINRLEAHLSYINSLDSYFEPRSREEIIEEAQKAPWWNSNQYDKYSEYSLTLKLDSGEDIKLSAGWCGYFECEQGFSVLVSREK